MNAAAMTDLSIVVVSYNTLELLSRCLQSVYRTVLRHTCEIIVVDNASTDGSADTVARSFPAVRLICNLENRGFARANNQAITESRGRYVLLLNSDAELLPGAADEMISFMEHRPKAGVVGARLLNPDGSFQGSFADFPSLWSELLLMTKLSRVIYPTTYPSYPLSKSAKRQSVDWVSGACMMVRRSAIDTVGLMDEEYFMYTEETDWCYRMRQAGWDVNYLPDARVVHRGGKSSDRVPETKRSRLYHSKLLFLRKHRGSLSAGTYLMALRVASLGKLACWSLASLNPNPTKRRRAVLNVRSYVSLLHGL